MRTWRMTSPIRPFSPAVPLKGQALEPAPPSQGFNDSAAPGKSAHEEIMHRAYSIWECAGRPDNCERAHWQQAEAEVLAQNNAHIQV